jgi:hypothetical protein
MKPAPLFAAVELRELSRLRRIARGASKGMRAKARKRLRDHVARCLRMGV